MWSHEWYDTRNRRNALRIIPVQLHWLSGGQLISKPHQSYTYPTNGFSAVGVSRYFDSSPIVTLLNLNSLLDS